MEDYNESSELPRKFDIVLEMEKVLDEIDKEMDMDNTNEVLEQLSYLRFLVKDLDDMLSGEYEDLRYRKFILKRK